MIDGTTFSSFAKEALSRLDKEVAKGTVSYRDVVPGAGQEKGLKTLTGVRAKMREPAPVSEVQLGRTQEMKGRLYEAQARVGLRQGGAALGVPEARRVIQKPMPGMGPATLGVPGVSGGLVLAPPSAGRFLRGVAGPKADPGRTMQSTMAAWHPLKGKQLEAGFLPKPAKVDPSLNLAVLQHELGEAATLGRMQKKLKGQPGGVAAQPAASHFGPEPIIRENLALQGDPKAMGIMAKLRRKDEGDVTLQKAIRQAGGTPDAPLAVGGKQQRAVEKILSQRMRGGAGAGAQGRQTALKLVSSRGTGALGYSVPPAVSNVRGELFGEAKTTGKDILRRSVGAGKRILGRGIRGDIEGATKELNRGAAGVEEAFQAGGKRVGKKLAPVAGWLTEGPPGQPKPRRAPSLTPSQVGPPRKLPPLPKKMNVVRGLRKVLGR